MRGLLRASHFQPTLAVTTIATVLALAVGRGIGAMAVFAAVLCGQLSVGWSNDYIDRDRDAAAGRLDKPIVAGDVADKVVGRSAVIAFALMVPLSMLSGWRAAAVHVLAVMLAWAYNLGLKRTLWSVVPYALAFAALPAFMTLGLAGHPWPPVWAVGAAASMGAGAHFINALPDRAADELTGVRGLPQRLSYTGGLIVGVALIAASLALLAVGTGEQTSVGALIALAIGALAVVAVVVAAFVGRQRAAWSLTLVAAGSAVVALVFSGDALVS